MEPSGFPSKRLIPVYQAKWRHIQEKFRHNIIYFPLSSCLQTVIFEEFSPKKIVYIFLVKMHYTIVTRTWRPRAGIVEQEEAV
jgi:hypothetical protein